MSHNRAYEHGERLKDIHGRTWEFDATDGVWYRLVASYRRDKDGNMTNFWSDDPWVTARIVHSEV